MHLPVKSNLRLLYVDSPFENRNGGDKNRSRFLWNTLQNRFHADCLLIDPPSSTTQSAKPNSPPVLTLHPQPSPWWESDSVHHFAPDQQARFIDLLNRTRYDMVVIRFHSPVELARLAHQHPSQPTVVVDLDMLSSRLASLNWNLRRSFSNRWFLLERWKLNRLERSLLRHPWLVLLSNPVELDSLRPLLPTHPPFAHLAEFPNVMPPASSTPKSEPQPVILFFGSLNSSANVDACHHLLTNLLPLLVPLLRKHQLRIQIVGKSPPPDLVQSIAQAGPDLVELVGEVSSMEQAIAAARLILLPIRIASGTRTRILEAATQARPVVTTPIGAEGLDLADTVRIHESPADLAAAVAELLDAPAQAEALGQRFHQHCLTRYSFQRVASDLLHELESFQQRERPNPKPS
jgi:glycosyltransferase involved in cell wall biosynthesis